MFILRTIKHAIIIGIVFILVIKFVSLPDVARFFLGF